MPSPSDILKSKFLRAVKDLPLVIANEAENISLDAFKSQSWQGVPWIQRKKGAKRNDRPILIDTGALRRGIYAYPQNANLVIWGNDVRYARIHNYGGVFVVAGRSEVFLRNRITVGKNKGRFKKGITKPKHGFTFNTHTVTMPQRQFMGNHPAVQARLAKSAQAFLLKQFNT